MPSKDDNIPPAPDLRRSPYTDEHGRNIGASADQIVTPGIFDTAQVEAVLEEDEDGMRDHISKLLERVQAEGSGRPGPVEAVPAEPIEACDPTVDPPFVPVEQVVRPQSDLPPPFDWRQIAHAEPGEDTVESVDAQVPQHLPTQSDSLVRFYWNGERVRGWRLWVPAFLIVATWNLMVAATAMAVR